jgi:hypothetical protein
MRRDLELRLRAVEVARSGRIEIWVRQGDGLVQSLGGEQMTFEEAEALCRAAGTIPMFISETDARLLMRSDLERSLAHVET